ncbi:hypothetical protein HMPREF9713_01129 [Myroides odoratimimus CCUG 12700]|uniref:hypothetical protein n=1 Tax=Myroides odoratimimus TaxID=76832 RepID=UPI00035481DC|nr:hypothetical protein [Myroides odoratimimus]EPH12288.1 hypothetical protein HMPREF9713_01129 [Myroides odoratimimus CCUG 12700]
MNYIKHLTHWFELLKTNTEAKPTHIALYIALFQLWNQSRFLPSFIINKPELMNLCKMGSKTSYSNCMSDMHRWGWIHYTPSFSKHGASTVSLKNWSDDSPNSEYRKSRNKANKDSSFETSSGTGKEIGSEISSGTATRSEGGYNYKTDKQQTDKNKDLNNFKKDYHEPM